VLSLVVELVRDIVDIEVQIEPMAERFRDRQIQHIKPRSPDRGIFAVKSIVSNVPVTQRTIEAVPTRQSQTSICDRVWRAIDVNPGRFTTIKRIRDLGNSPTER